MWLIAAAATLVVAYFALFFAAPVAFAVAAAVVLGLVLLEYATAAAWVFRGAAAPIDHLRIEPIEGGDPPHEPAYRSYYFGPVFRDYRLAVVQAAQRGGQRAFTGLPADPSVGRPRSVPSLGQRLLELWNSIGQRTIYPVPVRVILFGPAVAAGAGLVAGAVAAAALALVWSAVFGVLILATVLGALLVAGVLRSVETGLLWLRGITLECGVCHHRATAPWYVCPFCASDGSGRQAAVHRKLVPGSHGVFNRTCRCGNAIPTVLAKGKAKLVALCQECHAELPRSGFTAPTFHVPVVAGRNAGKSVFMTAAVATLERAARTTAGKADVEFFAEPAVIPDYVRARDSLQAQSFSGIAVTQPVRSVRAFNIYLGRGRGRRLLYLYDAAGERYEGEAGLATLRYLEHSGGVVVVVDPFSFESVRRFTEDTVLDGVRYSETDADDVVGRFAESLRQVRGRRADRRLPVRAAVVLTKCDALLEVGGVPHPYDSLDQAAGRPQRSAAVRDWLLATAGAGGLVSNLDSAFERSGYFAVSARDAFDPRARPSRRTRGAVLNDDPAMPLRWLLDRKEQA
jgi:hypothetical protein